MKSKWTKERIAYLGFLRGCGFDTKRIAEDPMIASTPNNVHRQAQRFGLAFRESKPAFPRLPPEAAARFDAAAERRGVTREAIVERILIAAGSDENLIENILDDRA